MEGEGLMKLLADEKLLALDGIWRRESEFSLGIQASENNHAETAGPLIMNTHTQH